MTEQLNSNKSELYVLQTVNYKLQERLKCMHTILVHLLNFVSNIKLFLFYLFRIYIKTYFPEVLSLAHLKFFLLSSIGELHSNPGGIGNAFIKAPTGCGTTPGSVEETPTELWAIGELRKSQNKICQQQERNSEFADFLIYHEVQNQLQVFLLASDTDYESQTPVGRALYQITGPNDKRNFCKIVPLSYCGLVMPNFFSVLFRDFWTCLHGIKRGKKWSPYQTLKMIGFNNVNIKIIKMNYLSIQSWSISLVYEANILYVFSKGSRTPHCLAFTKYQK